MDHLRILFIGDVVGATGRAMFQKHIGRIRKEYKIDAVVVNGENSSNQGRGITSRIVNFFRHNGVDVVTSGNHIWYNREIYSYLDEHKDLLRPANYPSGTPGVGVTTFQVGTTTVGIINLQGRVFMKDHIDCPFRAADSILTYVRNKTKVVFVDIHAEATSEKYALAYYLDGRVSGVVGTHTHIQTADEQILPGGTGYITDLGFSGSLHSLLGMKKEPIIQNFLTQMPVRFVVETTTPVIMSGVWMEVDVQTGKTIKIERIRIVDDAVHIDGGDED